MAWKTRAEHLAQNYSITEEIYDKIFQHQNGKCAICGCHQRYQRLSVDHDHQTGQVRGLLCMHCNRALGHMFDSALRLRNAAEYIERAKQAWNEVMNNGHS